jgi:hypothetical protein
MTEGSKKILNKPEKIQTSLYELIEGFHSEPRLLKRTPSKP